MGMKYRTTFTAKADVVEPNSAEFKAVAATLSDRYGFDLKPQMDLLYVRACLVSAGDTAGVNDNDDIFTREEAWAARQSPVLKPFNWQHNDKDILGVIYTVQARNLDGDVLDINDNTPPDCDFDLWVEAAIFRLIHEKKANEIEARSKAKNLFVSMEAWFDDYSYGLCTAKGQLSKVVARNKSTAFLDQHLRAGGGAGVYRDPESNQEMRIGRVLKAITFGGCGFVDRPANKRSFIDAVESMASMEERNSAESQIELLLQKVLESQGNVEDMVMNLNHTQANQDMKPEAIESAVDSALEKREKAAAAQREKDALVARASEAETRGNDLKSKIDELSQAQQAKDTELQALRTQLEQYGNAVNSLVTEHVAAGATSDTPAEIAAIDNAKTGADAFAAKIAWIAKSVASLKTRAARAAELEAKLAEAEAVVREQDVRALLGETVSPEALEIFVSHASKLDQKSYESWRDEKELMVLEITAAAKKEMPFPPKKGAKPVEEKPADKGCANVFEALLSKRRSESGTANPDTMNANPNEPDLINPQADGQGVNSGVSPQGLRKPRHQIAGSAGNNPAQALENAQADSGVTLAGSNAGGEVESTNPFRVLAGLVVRADVEDSTEAKPSKPGFDPVQSKEK